VSANAKAGIYQLKSSVAANTHATTHGFTTYSLPLPAIIGSAAARGRGAPRQPWYCEITSVNA
jgi:hypothetical protein